MKEESYCAKRFISKENIPNEQCIVCYGNRTLPGESFINIAGSKILPDNVIGNGEETTRNFINKLNIIREELGNYISWLENRVSPSYDDCLESTLNVATDKIQEATEILEKAVRHRENVVSYKPERGE